MPKGPSFGLLDAKTATDRIGELQRLIEYWYGPRKRSFGETKRRLKIGLTDGRTTVSLPLSLANFYLFAGRWPSPDPCEFEYFYEGSSGHQLFRLDRLRLESDGKILIGAEHQGGTALTVGGDDPPVWYWGRWNLLKQDYDAKPSTQLACSELSRFLVTHVLMASCYEYTNYLAMDKGDRCRDWFRRSPRDAELLWTGDGCSFPNYYGAFFLFRERILVHTLSSDKKWVKMVTRDPDAARQLKEHGSEGGVK